jgi:hypothetical protein
MESVRRGGSTTSTSPVRGVSLLLALFPVLFTVQIAIAQQIDPADWGVGPSGGVFAAARSGNTVYVGGSFFGEFGRNSGGAVPLNIATARAPASYPRVAGRVRAVAADGTGGWDVGGWFPAVDGHPHANLAHIRTDGVDDAWTVGADNEVFALSLAGTTLYVGGDFDSLGGEARAHVAAVDAATGALKAWNPGANEQVATILATDRQVFFGGRFTAAAGGAHRCLVAVDPVSGVLGWDAGADYQVTALALRDSTLFIGGYFANVGGQLRRYLAAVNASTGTVLPWNPSVDRKPDFIYDGGPRVSALLVKDTTLYVAGSFKTIGGQYREGLAAVGVSSALATPWDPHTYSASEFGAYFTAVALSGDTLFVAGQADSIDGQPSSYLAALRISDASRLTWDPRPNWEVRALAVQRGTLYACGLFNSMGDWVKRNNLAAFDAATGELKPWDPEADDYVAALTIQDGKVYVGGAFGSVGGQPRGGIAALDTLSGAATAWNPGANGGVFALAPWKGSVLIGGGFSRVGGLPRGGAAAIDTATGLVTGWNPGANDIVYSIVPGDSVIYIGGWFSAIGGLTRRTLAAVDTVLGAPTGWAPYTDFVVETMALHDGTLFIGGPFSFVNGIEREGIAALKPNGELTGWAPGADAAVHALVALDSTIYAGGSFLTIGGQSRSSIAALDARTGAVRAWNPSPDGAVYGLGTDGSHLDIVGTFGRMGNWPRSGIASFTLGSGPGLTIPRTLFLAQNAPNPSTSATLIRYALPTAASVSLAIFDTQGRRMTPLISHELQAAGPHEFTVPTAGWKPGCYFYQLEAAGIRATRKMVVLK